MLCARERSALDDLKGWLAARFGARVRELNLFGSRARGEGHELSDVDVAIVIDGLTSAEAREIGFYSGDLMTEYEVRVSPFVTTTEHIAILRRRELLIATEIDRDRVLL